MSGIAENSSANADFFSYKKKKLKVFQKLDNFYKYRLFCRPFVWSSATCFIHTYQETRMKEAFFQTEA